MIGWKPGLMIAVLVAGATLYTGCGTHQTILQRASSGPYKDAVLLYQQACLTCHGSNLQGKIGPNLQHVGEKLGLQQITAQIDNGGGPMPGYGPNHLNILSNEQIHELATWLETLK